MLVPLPIASLIGALVSDLVFWWSGGAFWATASVWLVGTGLVSGAVAVVAGLVGFAGSPRIREIPQAWHQFLGNALAMILAALNLFLRLPQGEAEAILPGACCSRP